MKLLLFKGSSLSLGEAGGEGEFTQPCGYPEKISERAPSVLTGEGGKWVQRQPDVRVGMSILKINGSIFCFSYLVSEEPFDLWGQGLDDIDKELTKYINSFRILKPKKGV